MPGTIDLYSLKGRTRQQNVAALTEGGEDVPVMNPRAELLISPGLPPRTELVRLGQTWNCKIALASAFATVAAFPTTRAELVLYNGEPVGGKSYVLDSAWSLGTDSLAAAGSVALLGQYVVGAAAPADSASVLTTSRNGKMYGGNAKKALAQTTMTANKWELLQTSQSGGSATAQIGLAAFTDLYGAWVIKPGDLFGLNLIAGTVAAASMILGLTYHEIQLPVF